VMICDLDAKNELATEAQSHRDRNELIRSAY
jgi:hypothetical protein